MTDDVLTLDDVTVHRGDIDAVRDLTWRMNRGENWAVIGPNGCGKSSLAAAIAGQTATSGEITYGFDDDEHDPCDRIATVSFQLQREFVTQSDGYYASRWYLGEEHATLTASEVLGLANNRNRKIIAARTALAEKMGLGHALDRQALHLSTGEMRRLLIARALILSPELLVLDEPLIGLDIKGRASLAKALHAIMRHGQPTLFLTARPWELPRGVTHGLYLKDGRVLGSARLKSPDAERLERSAFKAPPKRDVPLQKVRKPSASTRTAQPLIELRDISIKAGGAQILEHLDWTVQPGEHWAVLGPNGVGKTTLLSLLTGDHPQSFAQHVRMFGKLRGEQSTWELKAQIGYAAPDIALHYDGATNTLDFVCTGFFETLGLYQHATKSQTRTARKWLAFFGLEKLEDRPFRLLSDGHQRLVLLARAFVKQPRLLILDEPCQGLDQHARQRVCEALDAICARTPTTLVIVSHYTEELPHCITRRMTMRRGKAPLLSN